MKAQLSAFAISAIIIGTTVSPVSITSPATKAPVVKQAPANNISFFRTHRQGKGNVVASWGVNSSAGVIGFALQRTYEDPNDPYAFWEVVSTTPCNASRSYKHTDNNVFPGFINYRVVVMKNDGSEEMSAVSTVHIVSH